MESKTAVSEAVDILHAKGIRSSVRNLHGTPAQPWEAFLTTKHSPDATHVGAEQNRKKKDTERSDYFLISK